MKTVMEIDWSKAPEGATHYAIESGVYHGGFYKIISSDHGFFHDKDQWLKCLSWPELTKRPKSQPVYTQEMADNGELPQVGMEVMLNTEFNGFSKGSALNVYSHDVSSNENCVLAGGVVKGVSGGVQAFEFHVKYLSPIDTRTDKEKAFDDYWETVPAWNSPDDYKCDIREAFNAGVKSVGE